VYRFLNQSYPAQFVEDGCAAAKLWAAAVGGGQWPIDLVEHVARFMNDGSGGVGHKTGGTETQLAQCV